MSSLEDGPTWWIFSIPVPNCADSLIDRGFFPGLRARLPSDRQLLARYLQKVIDDSRPLRLESVMTQSLDQESIERTSIYIGLEVDLEIHRDLTTSSKRPIGSGRVTLVPAAAADLQN